MSTQNFGRRTIRAKKISGTNPMQPLDGRENHIIKMWEIGDAAPGSTKAKLKNYYFGALQAVDRTEARQIEASKSGRFTPEGATQDVRNFVLNEVAPFFKRGRTAIEAAKAEAAELRNTIKPAVGDRTDVVGAMLRAEMRAHLRGMPKAERDQFVSTRLEKMDPDLVTALLEVPSEFSGISDLHKTHLLERVLEDQHGEKIKELKDLEAAIEIAESAIETGRSEVSVDAGYQDPAAFNRDAEPFERQTQRFWLKKHKEKDGEVTRFMDWDPVTKTGAWRVAGPEQIVDGAFYNSWAEYQAANGGEQEMAA